MPPTHWLAYLRVAGRGAEGSRIAGDATLSVAIQKRGILAIRQAFSVLGFMLCKCGCRHIAGQQVEPKSEAVLWSGVKC